MAATDQHYRNQKTLDVIFGLSCAALLGSTLWMFVQDYGRPFKRVQQTFRDVEAALAERDMIDKLPSPGAVAERRDALRDARENLEQAQARVAGDDARLKAQRENTDDAYRGIKADYDAQMSYYNIARDEAAEAKEPSRQKSLQGHAEAIKKQLDGLQAKLDEKKAALDRIDAEIKVKVRGKLEGPEKRLADADEDLKQVTGTFDRFAKTAAQKTWAFGDTFRALPILDGFASPTRINQIWLPDLTIDYGGFKDVPRYDRCTTCHLGIDRGSFDRANLAALTDGKKSEEQTGKLRTAQKILQDRIDAGEKLGFSASDFPGERRGSMALMIGILLASTVVAAAALGTLTRSAGLGVLTLGIGGAITAATGVLVVALAPHTPVVKPVPLSDSQIAQYASHPRLDLFVDSNSPHPMEKFGCTTCHAGQGSATEFQLASHTPDDTKQKHHWEKNLHWHSSHYWDFPMLPARFVESSCVKCHHQMTDLIRHGSKEEAPKLLKGYNLVQEMGCFGCHEIAGVKGGRPVGPDLRLEPGPALDYLSPGEQEKARADAANPPGTLRKVGPSLRRLAEKTDQEWTRQWLLDPRGFRPDTKMPHFYGLSTNSPDVLPEEQKSFPAAEIYSISHYLLSESKGHLKAADSYRNALLGGKQNLGQLQGALAKGALSDRDMKELFDVSRRFSNLALLSSPQAAAAINRGSSRQRQLQERIQELHKKSGAAEGDKADLDSAVKELDAVTKSLVEDARPVSLAALGDRVVGEDGTPVTVPGKGDAGKGRHLFIEKGCLACHSHEGTATPGAEAVLSEANHGPELSRIAAKLRPELGPKTAQRWLVQWLLNPSVYHPRTRMPVTYLKPQEAADVAEWLLTAKTGNAAVDGWKGTDPAPKVDPAALRSLARVYLAKAQGMTAADLDAFLPKEKAAPGIPAGRLEPFARDADERILAETAEKQLGDDALALYVGRKAIGRLGCYACHDIPGFETAKPIGVGLNDWGKKDSDRIAFEDGKDWAKQNYHLVEGRDPKHPEAWGVKEKKAPYEDLFYHALEHHQREGFLSLKLAAPRSYDHNRLRSWDDRLRMPQFRFGRTRQKAGETPEAFEARRNLEEAAAREAVMTFILGLTAEPVPLKYVHQPTGDKLAEVKGREVLDKYNCGGCHQVRPGQYEFKSSPDATRMLEFAASLAASSPSTQGDHVFQAHSAWMRPATAADRQTLVGYKNLKTNRDPDDNVDDAQKLPVVAVRLTEAFRFVGADRVAREVRAGFNLWVPDNTPSNPDAIKVTPPYGGTFVELLVNPNPDLKNEGGYLAGRNAARFKDKEGDARGSLPPPLLREGERVRPDWLYQFLLNPKPIRPEGYMLLRMPRFNMSPEESRALVNYFAAVSRSTNPGAGVTYPYVQVDQKDPDFWQRRTAEYVKRLAAADKAKDARLGELKGAWERISRREQAELEAALPALRKAAEAAKGKPEADPLAKAVKEAEGQVEALKAEQKDGFKSRQARWEGHEAYAVDAYKLLTNKDLCLKCHSVGRLEAAGAQGPNLALAAERLRPDWTEWWIANPVRMFPYDPVMPQNFQKKTPYNDFQNLFVGDGAQQTRAARDALMDLPRLIESPLIRELSAGPGGR